MVGTTGRAEGGNYIAALDADTGKEAWRFYAIARPDAPGGNSWNAMPLDKRNGGSVWIPGSYDPVRNLAFFAPGNTYDTGPLRDLVQADGVNNDALYLDSTLALNPDTGELAWYFQHQANGQWDLDYAFERQVMQLRVGGAVRDVVVTGGKQMIFDILDVKSGQYLSSIDLGLQNLVMAIDPKTGAKRVSQELVPGDGQTKMVCPHVSGGRGWLPTAYDAATKLLYIPITEACMDLVPVPAGERGSLSTGVRWTVRPRPAISDRQMQTPPRAQPRDQQDGVGRSSAGTADGRHAGHGGRPRLRRFTRSHVPGARCGNRNDALVGPPEQRAERAADFLRGRRPRVRRRDRRPGRLSVAQLLVARPGDSESGRCGGDALGVRSPRTVDSSAHDGSAGGLWRFGFGFRQDSMRPRPEPKLKLKTSPWIVASSAWDDWTVQPHGRCVLAADGPAWRWRVGSGKGRHLLPQSATRSTC